MAYSNRPSMPGGPILRDDDVSRAGRSVRSDARSVARSVARSNGQSERSDARSEVRSERGPPSEYHSSRYEDDGRSVRTARTGRTGASSVRSSDRFSVAEGKIEELEYRLQQERIARLRSEGELEVLKRQALEGAIEAATAKAGTGIRR
mmetsp:Transcript_34288/g.85436  ORF Transcript_34288/g.85436 Transcript_34288/m.85436 type:complete len:149 (+) Transcript_34288:237-683(+)|eukprot:CAMPEP_0179839652 /NCGR_PEP_ID=MMETSP0982-20121206/1448_1 /TAXON_ID=483367 /ORGANISM="non described non described, Strain CCMP 2436" /LENGTH=148 /DNA_ID=CAMNT_0021723353 /DNA_START=160 /DNA_END=606 /DNA_ORIENTATION=+